MMGAHTSLLAFAAVMFMQTVQPSEAQEAARIWIQSVTVDASAGTLTITGTGFTDTCEVTLDGQVLTVLSGATATRLVAAAPAAVLATPGTYRLTVVDPARRSADAFEITVT